MIFNNAENKLDELKKEIAAERPYQVTSLDELLQTKFPENSWIIKKLIPREGITIISGAPSSFKTWLIMQMALTISSGEKFIGQFESEQGGVLIVDEENHPRIVKERMETLGAKSGLPIYMLSRTNFLVTDEKQREKLLKICEEYNLTTIFFDSLVRINAADENSASQMSEVFKAIMSLCHAGKTVILTHHERKEGFMKSSAQNRLRGSSDILAAVDSHVSVKRDKEDKSKLIVEQSKLRADRELDIFEVSLKDGGNGRMSLEYLGEYSPEATKKETAKELIIGILEEFTEGLSKKEIFEKISEIDTIGEKTVYSGLKELEKEGTVSNKPGVKNQKICYLT